MRNGRATGSIERVSGVRERDREVVGERETVARGGRAKIRRVMEDGGRRGREKVEREGGRDQELVKT